MISVKTKIICLAAALVQLAGSNSFAGIIGTTGALPTGITRIGGYYSGNGGEFTIGGSGLDLSGYVSGPTGSSVTSGAFQTFCIERDEYTFSGAGSFRIGTQAIQGGVNTNSGDALSRGVAWLYSQFASQNWDTPGSYNYVAGSGRSSSAGALQEAIWFLEQELTSYTSGNVFVAAALANFGNLAGAQTAASSGEFGVYIVNTYNQANFTGFAQDQLYYNPNGNLEVPDGGASVMLLGLALGGIVGLRRYLKA